MPRVSGLVIAALLTVLVLPIAWAADSEQPKTETPASSPDQTPASIESADGLWSHRAALIEIGEAVVAKAPKANDGSPSTSNPNRPFTYEEQAYDKPSRDWWWSAANYAVIISGGMILTYVTGGVIVPWVGGAIGGLSGLSGAAAISQGLAWLGGGAIAAGGFGMAGGTALILIMTDFAISTALEYSLRGLNTDERFKPLSTMIRQLDVNQDQAVAWQGLQREAVLAASKDYVLTTHAVATACMRWAADENLDRSVEEKGGGDNDDDVAIDLSDRQRVLIRCAIQLLEEARRLEPKSSLIHHALGNAYWWLSVRGGYMQSALQDESFALPATCRLSSNGDDELGCFDAAIWHYAQGAACEPRNVNVRINWANALQSDGTLHEAISVIAGALPHISSCKDDDKAAVIRTNAMLQYQAFTRSKLWERFESGKPFPTLQESPLLLASMEGYTKAVEYAPLDLTSLLSLAQVYRDAGPTDIGEAASVMPAQEVQFRVIETVLKKEDGLADIQRSLLPSSYKPGQLLTGYRDTLRWAFTSLSDKPLTGNRLKRLHSATDSWLLFVENHDIKMRPMSREVLLKIQKACKIFNDDSWLDYSLEALDRELSREDSDP